MAFSLGRKTKQIPEFQAPWHSHSAKGKEQPRGEKKKAKPTRQEGLQSDARCHLAAGLITPHGKEEQPLAPTPWRILGCPHPLQYSQSQGRGGSDHSRCKNKPKNGYGMQALPKAHPHLAPWHQLCAGRLSLSKRLFLLLHLGLGLKKTQGLKLQGHFVCQKGQSFSPLDF